MTWYVQVMPKANPKDDTKVDVDVMVKERPMKTADVDLSWGLAPNSHGIPVPADPIPGGSLTFENRNLAKKGNQFSASVTTENFLVPNDDIGVKVRSSRHHVACLNVSLCDRPKNWADSSLPV